MPEDAKRYSIYVVSDATGKTAYSLVTSILVQFKELVDRFFVTHYSFVRDQRKAEKIIKRAQEQNALIVHTFADNQLRQFMNYQINKSEILYIDVFEYAVPIFTQFVGKKPTYRSGRQYNLNENYFKKIEAIEFTIAHDDGQNLFDLEKSDIVLVGPSRTSKTPLSIYLANEGYKVSNIPLVNYIPVPEEVYLVNPKKIFALIINYETMLEIRKKRVSYLGQQASDYANPDNIFKELEYCRDLYKKNRQWRVIDVTKKAIEETAAEIIEKINGGEEVF